MSLQTLSVFLVLLFSIGCSQTAFQSHASSQESVQYGEQLSDDSIKESVAKLRECKADSISPALIPDGAKPLLTKLKHQLKDFIENTFASQNVRQVNPESLQNEILARLKNAGIVVEEPTEEVIDGNHVDNDYYYGDIYSIAVQQPTGHPDLLAITTTIGVCCGEDTSFYLFKHDGSGWRIVLTQEANDYSEISGAQGRFGYAISPLNKQGNFFVVTANVNPWCTSNWQSLHYKVFLVEQGANEARTILSKRDTIYLGVDDPVYEIKVHSTSFSLKFHDEGFMEKLNNGEEISLDDPESFHVLTYRVKNDQVTLLAQ